MAFILANLEFLGSYQNDASSEHHYVEVTWGYTTTDTLDTVGLSPSDVYFSEALHLLRANDWIAVKASDGNALYRVNNVTYWSPTPSEIRVNVTRIVKVTVFDAVIVY